MKPNVKHLTFLVLALVLAFAVAFVPAAPSEALWQCGDDAYEVLEDWDTTVYAPIEFDVPQYHTFPFTLNPAEYLQPPEDAAWPMWDWQYNNDVDWVKIYMYAGTTFQVEATMPGYHTQIEIVHTLSGVYGVPYHWVVGDTRRPVTLTSTAHSTGWQKIRIRNVNFNYPGECPHAIITVRMPNG